MTCLSHSDDDVLRQFQSRIPEHLKITDIVIYHPLENEEDGKLCRNYVDRLKANINLDDGRIPNIELYDDLFVPDVSKLGKFQHVEKFSHYKFIYVTEEFSNSEDMQRFFTETSLIVSVEDPKKRGTVIFVYQNKKVYEQMKGNIYQSLLIPLFDHTGDDQKVSKMLNSASSKQRKEALEESVKFDQIKWLKHHFEEL